jgi:ABC-type multidrug transport system fused ATPase/permease subunit
MVSEDLATPPPFERAAVYKKLVSTAWAGEQQKEHPSLVRALLLCFGVPLMVAQFFVLCYTGLVFINPILLELTIEFLDEDSDEPAYMGYVYVGGILFTSLCMTLSKSAYFWRNQKTGIRCRVSTTLLLYEKAMRCNLGMLLSPEGATPGDGTGTKATQNNKAGAACEGGTPKAQEATDYQNVGSIVNLASTDAQRLQDIFWHLHVVWSGPLQVAVAMYFLYQQLGVHVFVGLVLMSLLTLCSAYISSCMRKIQRKLLRLKDKRIVITNEVVAGMKIIKMYAWEKSFEAKIHDIRQEELALLWEYMQYNVVTRMSWVTAPSIVLLATIYSYTHPDIGNKQLTPAKAFTSLALFNVLKSSMAIFPDMVVQLIEANLSVNRIHRFLQSPEVPPLSRLPAGHSTAIELHNVTLHWDATAPTPANLIVKNATASIARGEFCVITGSTGCGKSALLSLLTNDLAPLSGTATVRGSVAYCSQVAWCQHMTLKDNILFGAEYDPDLYRQVIFACALLPDLDSLPGGDQTEIGERGINLSGGQKQRVALARALYQQRDIYILDDCLSAVDAHVCQHIVQHCIHDMLVSSGRTVVLVTHHLWLLPQADKIILFGPHHEFDAVGTFKEVQRHSNWDLEGLATAETYGSGEVEQDATTRTSVEAPKPITKKVAPVAGPSSKLVDTEEMASGEVSWEVYLAYFRAAGGPLFLLAIVTIQALYSALQIAGNIFLGQWADGQLSDYNGVVLYGSCTLGYVFFVIVAVYAGNYAGVQGARGMHGALLSSVMRAPMSFFDTTPCGRILNRFSNDTYTIDMKIQGAIYICIEALFLMISSLAVILLATYLFSVPFVAFGFFYYLVYRYYVSTSRQIKRLESVSKSPILEQLSETLTGLPTIRAFDASARFSTNYLSILDANIRTSYNFVAALCWLVVNLETVSSFVIASCAAFVVYFDVDDATAGLAISYGLLITVTMNILVFFNAERENAAVSIERVLGYAQVAPEAALTIAGSAPPPGWPHAGAISIQGVVLRYRPGLPKVLKGLSMDILPGEKVGIVGRTGAGKSSMLQMLLRLVEVEAGAVVIDGVNVATVGLHDLRKAVSIIPQDPVLFSGSVRFNLDPFEESTDAELWGSLEAANLAGQIRGLSGQLHHQVEEGGRNFSVGERQCLCLSRALLRRSNILLLDEATSSVDAETDVVIGKAVTLHFPKATVLTIAHRLNTIYNSDRVVVLDDGKVAEFDTPATLLADPSSLFYAIKKASEGESGIAADAE